MYSMPSHQNAVIQIALKCGKDRSSIRTGG
jgi:hypothetical protein